MQKIIPVSAFDTDGYTEWLPAMTFTRSDDSAAFKGISEKEKDMKEESNKRHGK